MKKLWEKIQQESGWDTESAKSIAYRMEWEGRSRQEAEALQRQELCLGYLVALDTNIYPQEYTLHSDICEIGRARTCDIIIPSMTISRQHACIERSGCYYLLCDIGSRNGTFVNGEQMYAPYLLRNDDVIGLGSPFAMLRFSTPLLLDNTTIPC